MTYSIFLTTTILAIILYADDLQIYIQVPFNQLEEGINQLSVAAQVVSDWAGASGLGLNPGKMQAIFFTTERKVHRINRRPRAFRREGGEPRCCARSDTILEAFFRSHIVKSK